MQDPAIGTSLRLGYLAAMGAVLIWSGFILVSRVGGISALSSFDVIAIRYVTCALLVLPVWFFRFRFNLFQPKFIICSLIGGLGYALFTFNGFELTTASQAAVLLPGLMPVMVMLLATWLNRQKQSWNKWLGMTVISFGVGLLFWQEFQVTGDLSYGHLSLAGAAFCWTLFSVLVQRWQTTPWQATVSLAVITCIIYLPFYVVFCESHISLSVWRDVALQSFYQGFLATIVQMMLYVRAVQIIGAASMGTMMAMVPIISGVSALYLFDEPATLALVVAMTLVSSGVWLCHSRYLSQLKNKQVITD